MKIMVVYGKATCFSFRGLVWSGLCIYCNKYSVIMILN